MHEATRTTQTVPVRWPDELPALASDPRVTVLTDLRPGDSDQCGVHPEPDRHCQPGEVPVPEGVWKITYRWFPDVPEHWTWVCGSWCADAELTDLLGDNLTRPVHDVTLHLATYWAHALTSALTEEA